MLLYETGKDVWKCSLRSRGRFNAARTASLLGGGGHEKAAGCTLEGTLSEVKERITEAVRLELTEGMT